MEAVHGTPRQFERWVRLTEEPDHQLAALDGTELGGGRLRILLGPSSRFGARYFAALLETDDGELSSEAVVTGLQHSGPLPSYNWIEVAETNQRISFPTGDASDLGDDGMEALFRLLFDILPPGGHLMVEYDSPQRAETAQGLAHTVPAIATPLGALLFRVGFGAHFKDWQIAEGGSEGPRKLQAYKPPSLDDTERWRRRAARDLRAFLERAQPASDVVRAARQRAEALLSDLS